MNTNALIITNSGAPPATNDIRALKPPIEIPNGWLWLWIALGLVALAVALFSRSNYGGRRPPALFSSRRFPRT